MAAGKVFSTSMRVCHQQQRFNRFRQQPRMLVDTAVEVRSADHSCRQESGGLREFPSCNCTSSEHLEPKAQSLECRNPEHRIVEHLGCLRIRDRQHR